MVKLERDEAKENYPTSAFLWSNLFLGCGKCNQKKGIKPVENCLKPDVDDPTDYLFVNPISLKIEPRPDISSEAKARARATIELYGLDRPELQREYILYWRKVALHDGPPDIQELTMNTPDILWIGEFINKNLPEVERRAHPTEEFSLMASSLITYHSKIT